MTENSGISKTLDEAKRFFSAGNYAQSESVIRTILAKNPTNEEASYLLAMALYRQRQYARAEEVFRQLVNHKPRTTKFSYGLAVTLEGLTLRRDAIAELERIMALAPDFSSGKKKLAELREKEAKDHLWASSVPIVEVPPKPARSEGMRRRHDVGANQEGQREPARSGDPSRQRDMRANQEPQREPAQSEGVNSHSQQHGLTAGLEPPPEPSSPVVQRLDDLIKHGTVGQGKLTFQGRRLLRSYVHRFVLAVLLCLLGISMIRELFPGVSALRTMSGLTAAEERLKRFESVGSPPPILTDLQRLVEQAQVSQRELAQRFILFGFLFIIIAGLIVLVAILSSLSTSYLFYERRIHLKEGIFFRRSQQIWLYDIDLIEVQQPLYLMIVGTARLRIRTDNPEMHLINPYLERRIYATGFGSAALIEKQAEQLRRRIIVQRRDVHGQWI